MPYDIYRSRKPSLLEPCLDRIFGKVPLGKTGQTKRRRQFLVLLVGVLILPLAAAALRVMQPTLNPIYSAERVQVVSYILHDYTDGITTEQDQAIDELLGGPLRDQIQGGQAVIIGTLLENPDAPIRQTHIGISPRRASNILIPLLSTPKMVEADWELVFGDTLDQANQDARSPSYNQTPLRAGIEAAYQSALARYPNAEIRLFIITDGLEHTNAGGPTMYGSTRSPRYLFRPEVTERLKSGVLPMAELDVVIYLLERPDHTDRSGRNMYQRQIESMAFWTEYLRAAAVKNVNVRPL